MANILSVYHSFTLTPNASVRYAVKGNEVNVVIFLGVGQSGNNLRKIIEAMPANSAAVEALPYHQIPRDQMEKICSKGIPEILKTLTRKPANLDIIAESQAAPTIVIGLSQMADTVRSLTLLEPLGFNKSSLGDTSDERYRSLMQRSQRFWNHSNQTLGLRANRDTLWEISKRSIPAWYRIRPDYTFGANQDVIQQTKKLAGIIPVRIYADKNDSLFPYDEIVSSVKDSAIMLVESHAGSHLNRATPKGLAELDTALTSLQDQDNSFDSPT